MTINGVNNGSAQVFSRPIKPGVFAPLPTFFFPDSQDLDIPTFKKHVLNIAQAGVGLLISGSMGEAHHLAPSERIELIKAAREALDDAGLTNAPIIAGTGAGSTRETIKLSREAAEAGADYVIVIASGFFAGVLKDDRLALKEFWSDVAQSSPLPVIIYNYPGASGGIDLESDLIEELAAEHANIIGVKLTCGNVGKLTRIAATTTNPAWVKAHPRSIDSPFLVLGGFTDFITPSVFANAHGAITGLANVAPYAIRHLSDLSFAALAALSIPAPAKAVAAPVKEVPPPASTRSSPSAAPEPLHPLHSESDPIVAVAESVTSSTETVVEEETVAASPASALELLTAAQQLQGVIAKADRTIALTGIAGTKFLLQRLHEYPAGAEAPRKPLRPTTEAARDRLWEHKDTKALLALEELVRGAATQSS